MDGGAWWGHKESDTTEQATYKGPSACMCVLRHFRLFATPWTVARQALLPMDSPGKNTGVSCHFLLQGIFPTQESNLGLLYCRLILY